MKCGKRKCLPVVKRTYLSDGGFLTSLVGSSKPGEKKMQFPYEIPEIKVSPVISPETKTTLYTTVGILAGGIVISGLARMIKL